MKKGRACVLVCIASLPCVYSLHRFPGEERQIYKNQTKPVFLFFSPFFLIHYNQFHNKRSSADLLHMFISFSNSSGYSSAPTSCLVPNYVRIESPPKVTQWCLAKSLTSHLVSLGSRFPLESNIRPVMKQPSWRDKSVLRNLLGVLWGRAHPEW